MLPCDPWRILPNLRGAGPSISSPEAVEHGEDAAERDKPAAGAA